MPIFLHFLTLSTLFLQPYIVTAAQVDKIVMGNTEKEPYFFNFSIFLQSSEKAGLATHSYAKTRGDEPKR